MSSRSYDVSVLQWVVEQTGCNQTCRVSHINTSGILYNPIGYNLNKETGRVDYDEMEKLALEHKPKLIIGGGSAYSREWDYARMRKIADEVGALLMTSA